MRNYLITIIVLSLCAANPDCRVNTNTSFTRKLNQVLPRDKTGNYTDTYLEHLDIKLYPKFYKVLNSFENTNQHNIAIANKNLYSYCFSTNYSIDNNTLIPSDVGDVNVFKAVLIIGFAYVYLVMTSN